MSPIDSLWTLDNILGTATGWTGDASGSRRSVADARRRLSHFASSVGRDVFVDAIVSLIDAVGAGGLGTLKDEARRKGAVGCLDETWFALALAGSSDTDTEPTDEGGGVVARLYWRLLRDTNTNGVKGMDSGRMQTLGAVAFAPGVGSCFVELFIGSAAGVEGVADGGLRAGRGGRGVDRADADTWRVRRE
jgi:hypothetical protein